MYVSFVSCKDRKTNIAKALGLIKGDIVSISNTKRILIKPNLTGNKPTCANTHPEAIRAVVEYITDEFGTKEFIVGEGSGSAYLENSSTERVFSACGFYDLERQYQTLHLVNFDKMDHTLTIPIETCSGPDIIYAVDPKALCDYVIFLAIPKTHDYAIVTLSINNMVGLVRPQERIKIHGIASREIQSYIISHVPVWLKRVGKKIIPESVEMKLRGDSSYEKCVKLIHRNLLSLAKVLMPNLAVLDGFECMEGNGPVAGYPISLGVAFASCDPVLADSLGTKLMGLEPEEIGYLKYCADEGIGSLDLSNVKGDNPDKISVKFRMHVDYEIQKRWAQ